MYRILPVLGLTTGMALLTALPNHATALKITVNSNADTIVHDDVITLREAIALTNGTINPDQLTQQERAQVRRPIMVNDRDVYQGKPRSIIRFDLPDHQTTIRLELALPPIQTSGIVIDATIPLGSNQQPQVTIYSTAPANVQRGLWIQADGVVIRGLSFLGFGQQSLQAYSVPTGNIVIGQWATNNAPEKVVKDIVVAQNWLGRSPQFTPGNPDQQSGFGLYIFNATQIDVRDNWIVDNRASGIITGKTATQLTIQHNQISHNGAQGMADGIRLEGNVDRANILSNEIENNSGSAIYLFKPQGQVSISDNQITNINTDRAAIYLMGHDHIVQNNQINSASSGVVVSAYPRSRRNRIIQNRFRVEQGLSIDLVSQRRVGVWDYSIGDGQNQPSAQYPSQWDFANGGIDAPQLLSREFMIGLNGQVEIAGTTLPNASIELYRSRFNQGQQSVLTTPVKVPVKMLRSDVTGRFYVTLGNLKPGDRVSAIVTHPDYGTSEASRSSLIRQLD